MGRSWASDENLRTNYLAADQDLRVFTFASDSGLALLLTRRHRLQMEVLGEVVLHIDHGECFLHPRLVGVFTAVAQHLGQVVECRSIGAGILGHVLRVGQGCALEDDGNHLFGLVIMIDILVEHEEHGHAKGAHHGRARQVHFVGNIESLLTHEHCGLGQADVHTVLVVAGDRLACLFGNHLIQSLPQCSQIAHGRGRTLRNKRRRRLGCSGLAGIVHAVGVQHKDRCARLPAEHKVNDILV